MSGPVLTRRALVAGAGAALGAVVVLGAVSLAPAAFDPGAFVADLRVAGCAVVLMRPGTCFAPGDEVATWFVRPARGYSAVMARWADAMEADPDHVERVAAYLADEVAP